MVLAEEYVCGGDLGRGRGDFAQRTSNPLLVMGKAPEKEKFAQSQDLKNLPT